MHDQRHLPAFIAANSMLALLRRRVALLITSPSFAGLRPARGPPSRLGGCGRSGRGQVGLRGGRSRPPSHMLFHVPPGVGKTMLAERVPGLLPDLEVHDALEVSAVHSLAGFNLADELITRPPYSDPHHSASVASIVGGGQRMAKPGAISCAHAKVSLGSMGRDARARSARACGPRACYARRSPWRSNVLKGRQEILLRT
jgi:hypothetical protein